MDTRYSLLPTSYLNGFLLALLLGLACSGATQASTALSSKAESDQTRFDPAYFNETDDSRDAALNNATLNREIKSTLNELFQQSTSSERLAQGATALLVFPNIIKAAIGVGGEYGEGVLIIDNKIVDHYSVKGLSLGVQFGVHSKSLVILFLEPEELNYFRLHSGWKMGVDGAITLAVMGVAGEMDSLTARKSSIGYVFNNRGLIYDLSLKGAKFSKLPKETPEKKPQIVVHSEE